MVLLVARAEGNGEQSTLASATDVITNVEERSGNSPIIDVADRAGLFDDIQAIGLGGRTRDECGAAQA
jgi:hypothetical protein